MADALSHFDDSGRPLMVDVTAKAETERTATARGRVSYSEGAYAAMRREGIGKGDILRVAELAGVMGAKRAPDLIPLCHPLALTSVSVAANFDDQARCVDVSATVKSTGRTGVEMEALTAVSVACLTVYDMTKAVDKAMVIGPIELVAKSGGKSGAFVR